MTGLPFSLFCHRPAALACWATALVCPAATATKPAAKRNNADLIMGMVPFDVRGMLANWRDNVVLSRRFAGLHRWKHRRNSDAGRKDLTHQLVDRDRQIAHPLARRVKD